MALLQQHANHKTDHFFQYILDIIDTKLYKPVENYKKPTPKYLCTVNFCNKAVECIRLSSIFNLPEVIQLLPSELQTKENIPVVTFKLGNTVRNKILNYKETVNSIFADEEVSFSLDTDPCECANSSFKDPHHQRIISGDLRIIENSKLRRLLTKGPNYREPRSLNFSKHLMT